MPAIARILRLGSTGPDVRWVQERLRRGGYSVPLSGVYGDETEEAVRTFQAGHLGTNRRQLVVDGEVLVRGDATWWALAHPGGAAQDGHVPADKDGALRLARKAPTAARAAVLEAAAAEVGVREKPDGSNGGPRVDEYTDGWRVAWCALFVSWCVRRGTGRDQAFPPHRARASVQKIAAWGAERGLVRREASWPGEYPEVLAGRPIADPVPGDVFLMLDAGGDGVDAGRGHTGFVLRVNRDTVDTVEGNVGNGVRVRRRERRTIAGYVQVLG